jgi:hypothetical protein
VRAIAFDVDHAPQLVAGLPSQAFANTAAFKSEDYVAQEGDTLARWDVIADPTRSLCSTLDEGCQGGSAFTRIDIVGPAWDIPDH